MKSGGLVRLAVRVLLLLALGLVAGLLLERRFRNRKAGRRPAACESCPSVCPDCACEEGFRAP